MTFITKNIATQPIHAPWLTVSNLTLDVLRLDAIHPIISGNKWFKLKAYMADATQQGKQTIATFGGAYSNHIIASAHACMLAGFSSIGFIRGDETETLSHTLQAAKSCGMQLIHVDRTTYRNKQAIIDQYNNPGWYWINEGGYGKPGANGAAHILEYASNKEKYTHIIAAVGTGTMLAGLIQSAKKNQKVIGISSMKGNAGLAHAITHLLDDYTTTAAFTLLHDYHFGGYAKHPSTLINFINDTYLHHNLPLDIVYTGKTFFAIKDLADKQYFEPGSKLLMIHSGGLQGNTSLSDKVLAF